MAITWHLNAARAINVKINYKAVFSPFKRSLNKAVGKQGYLKLAKVLQKLVIVWNKASRKEYNE